MTYLLAISYFLSIINLVIPISYISTNNLELRYVINYKNKCISNNARFGVWKPVSITECIKECALRKHCSGLNYMRYSHVCELFSTSVDGDLINGQCIFIPALDITIVQSLCASCDIGKVCDPNNGACLYKECNAVNELVNGHVFGNINHIGGRKKITCKNDVNLDNATYALCLNNGQWSGIRNCTQDNDKCLSNPCHNGGTCEAHGDSFRCTCTAGYKGTTCSVDCYVNTSRDYAGKKNVTITGFACERWDEHIGEWNIDATNAPESTLTEAENYCRNPSPNDWDNWCFSSRVNTEWEYCDINKC